MCALLLDVCMATVSTQACQSGRILRTTKVLGSYKLDVATVYAQEGRIPTLCVSLLPPAM